VKHRTAPEEALDEDKLYGAAGDVTGSAYHVRRSGEHPGGLRPVPGTRWQTIRIACREAERTRLDAVVSPRPPGSRRPTADPAKQGFRGRSSRRSDGGDGRSGLADSAKVQAHDWSRESKAGTGGKEPLEPRILLRMSRPSWSDPPVA